MKLSARKSMVAMGTAMAMALVPVTVPSVAPVAYAITVSKSNYRSLYDSAPNRVEEVKTALDTLSNQLELDKFTRDDPKYLEAAAKRDSAKRYLDNATSAWVSLSGEKNANEYTEERGKVLRSIIDQLDDAKDRTNEGTRALLNSFTCTDEDGQDSDSGSSPTGSIDTFSSKMGSSKKVVVVKDGKKYCKTQSSKLIDDLSSFAKTLGVILSVVTAVAALNTAINKNIPTAPKN